MAEKKCVLKNILKFQSPVEALFKQLAGHEKNN